MNAVIYARYSSERQTEQSIEGQLRVCREYAERNGYTIVNEYIDRALSGTSDARPEFQRMIKDSERKQFQFVIVWKLDRFSRNRYDSAIYKRQLKINGVRVISATESLGSGDESLILEAILEAMAENYSRQLAQNVRRGLNESALKGNSTGGTTPYGYNIVDKRLTINEKEAEVVRWAFEAYAAGKQKKEIAETLNAKGLRNKYGKPFTVSSFVSMFKNQKYIGIYSYNGEIMIEDGCPAIISKELFEKCRERTEKNRRAPASAKAVVDYILNGKMFCGYCGGSMVGDSGTSRNGERHYYYSCNNRKKPKEVRCKKKREKKDFIEWYVVEQTIEYVLAPARIDYISKRVAEAYNNDFSLDQIKVMEKRIAEIDREVDELVDTLIRNKSPIVTQRINERAELLEVQRKDAEVELSKLRILAQATMKEEDVAEWLRRFCKGDLFDPEFRKKIVDAFVNSIYLFDDKVVFYYNVGDGEQVSYIEMSDDLENDDLFECSNLLDDGPPPTDKSEPLYFFKKGVFGFIISR